LRKRLPLLLAWQERNQMLQARLALRLGREGMMEMRMGLRELPVSRLAEHNQRWELFEN
jgi:hypothetical protein